METVFLRLAFVGLEARLALESATFLEPDDVELDVTVGTARLFAAGTERDFAASLRIRGVPFISGFCGFFLDTLPIGLPAFSLLLWSGVCLARGLLLG